MGDLCATPVAVKAAQAIKRLYRFGQRIRYVANQGMWRVWNGKCWEEDQKNKLDRASKRVAKELFEEAMNLEEEERNRMLQWAIKSESRDRRSAMIDLAAKERSVISLIEDYDRDPWLFNVQNGTIDLKMQTLRSHRPEEDDQDVSGRL